MQHACWLVEIGLTPYDAASWLQQQLVSGRKSAAIPDVLLFCEHPHVITLGRNGQPEHLKARQGVLAQMNVEFRLTDRGGDITYHGPGQVVGYPILDLAQHRRDVRWYVERLEEVMIRTAADFNVRATRVEGRHGVWVEGSSGEEKLAAIGVHLSRWVTSHGFAFNVSTDLRFFDLIVPCGILDRRATSLERLLGRTIHTSEVCRRLAAHFGDVFQRQIIRKSLRDVEQAIGVQVREQQSTDARPAEAAASKGIHA